MVDKVHKRKHVRKICSIHVACGQTLHESEEEEIMWNLGRRTSHRKAALAEGYMDVVQEKDSTKKFSGSTAMVLGIFITLEIMIGGAMIFNYDFHGADIIALLFAFMVLYSGVVAVLTDK